MSCLKAAGRPPSFEKVGTSGRVVVFNSNSLACLACLAQKVKDLVG